MSQEITKNLMCVLMREGVEIWIEEEKLEPLMGMLETKRFIKIDGRVINVADISGIYPAVDMEDRTRRMNGQWKDENGIWRNRGEWKCDYNNWHTKGDYCKCTNSLGYRIPIKKNF
jgi:hypothetical protein